MTLNRDDPGGGTVETFQLYRQGHDGATGAFDQAQVADILNVEDIGAEEFMVYFAVLAAKARFSHEVFLGKIDKGKISPEIGILECQVQVVVHSLHTIVQAFYNTCKAFDGASNTV